MQIPLDDFRTNAPDAPPQMRLARSRVWMFGVACLAQYGGEGAYELGLHSIGLLADEQRPLDCDIYTTGHSIATQLQSTEWFRIQASQSPVFREMVQQSSRERKSVYTTHCVLSCGSISQKATLR